MQLLIFSCKNDHFDQPSYRKAAQLRLERDETIAFGARLARLATLLGVSYQDRLARIKDRWSQSNGVLLESKWSPKRFEEVNRTDQWNPLLWQSDSTPL